MFMFRAGRLVATTMLSLAMVSCPFRKEEYRRLGPDKKANLAIYFNHGVTNEQIKKFWHEVLSRPDPQGKGYHHVDGVADLSRIYPAVQGHEGVALSFFSNATQAQRNEVERDIKSSPLVYKILKNVAPIDIKKLE